MHLDVQDLRNFYYRSDLGRDAQKTLRSELLKLWPEAKGQTVAGFGFAVPFLRPYLKDARRVIALMPGPQGVISWPQEKPNVSVLCEQPSTVLEECWRVLGPGGSALFIVPNRGGLWSRSDKTPFGFGRPYTQSQLENQLKTHNFLPERHSTILYQPPSERRLWRKTAGMWESLGGRLSMIIAGGVLIVEASKRVQAPSGPALRETVRKPLEVLRPAPEAKPV